jgi:hypothetical protein
MKLKTGLKTLFTVLVFTSVSTVLSAQPGDPGPDPDPVESVPFDGGLSVLIAAGAGLALKKRHDKKKKEKAIESE